MVAAPVIFSSVISSSSCFISELISSGFLSGGAILVGDPGEAFRFAVCFGEGGSCGFVGVIAAGGCGISGL